MIPRAPVWFVTGTDTGVGKTVFSTLLVRHWLGRGVGVRAVKPFCSGGRSDARALLAAQGGGGSLDDVNPWHFKAALTPLVAARREARRIPLKDVRAFLDRARQGCEVLVVEGAGGLLSPLGEGFDARTLIRELQATPVVVVANRLGCLSQALLVVEALGEDWPRAKLVLMQPKSPGLAAKTNGEILKERLGVDRVVEFPWLAKGGSARPSRRWTQVLDRLIA